MKRPTRGEHKQHGALPRMKDNPTLAQLETIIVAFAQVSS